MSTSYSVVVNGHTVATGPEAELVTAMYWRGRQQGWYEAIDAAVTELAEEGGLDRAATIVRKLRGPVQP